MRDLLIGICVSLFTMGVMIYLAVFHVGLESSSPKVDAQSPMKENFARTNQPIYYRDKVIVLLYHDVVTDPSSVTPYTILKSDFEEQMKALHEHSYNVISIDQYVNYVKEGAEIPPNAVVITFDDGYESFYYQAYPTLKQYHFPATNFIIVNSTDRYSAERFPHLTWEEIKEMKNNQMSFHNHTYNLHSKELVNAQGIKKPALSNRIYLEKFDRLETEEEYIKRVKSDLIFAEERLEQELGEREVKVLAFPFGSYNKDSLMIAKELGFDLVMTTKEGINTRENLEVYRINAGRSGISAEGLLDLLKKWHDR
ncbi:polysaccharide deacetylase family protein [Ammoniphilus resinae]|uniref:Poly-beta-1,6-N-acetyl-D-glucosamine N-deacetylase PgaB n=1 Tax=Ammoniphilus resinae TaxID=861532 RepID=A0ABS4GMG9_9BACL|nr:polysaccharide deacetylase family protein [Ammoniphilus resinae]MBP1931473.1 poly-beta-1,6-N-acetyl-D-glucosamine N-deacetylase PgaB [Ammoniphilus resinae]